jgi:hypothetical protein
LWHRDFRTLRRLRRVAGKLYIVCYLFKLAFVVVFHAFGQKINVQRVVLKRW